MDLVVVGALAVAAVLVFVGLAVGWWALRKTLSLVRRLVVLGLGLALALVILGSGLGIYLMW
ncbi:MAG: hypothetical protein R3F59_08810 [Myxococcota bacterium]